MIFWKGIMEKARTAARSAELTGAGFGKKKEETNGGLRYSLWEKEAGGIRFVAAVFPGAVCVRAFGQASCLPAAAFPRPAWCESRADLLFASMAVSLGLFASLPERLRRDLSDCPLPGAPDMSSPENLMAESLVLTGSAWARPEKTAEKA